MRSMLSAVLVVTVTTTVMAADIPVTPTKLIVVDKLSSAGKAKVVFVAKDAGATKGAGADVDQISVQLDMVYDNGNAAGAFAVPARSGNGWVANKDTVAKYVNKFAPAGPTEAKVAVIKPGKLLKLVGKGLGDTDFDVLGGGDPAGPVYTAYCVDNAGEENCHCSEFTGCIYRSIAGGTGAKLVCKTGQGDPQCTARGSTTCYVDTGLTVIDTCNGLEWEKKDTAVGSGIDLGNLHDVDNNYTWAGRCTGPDPDPSNNAHCQPNAAAAATCAAQTGGALGCGLCGAGEGTCDPGPPILGGSSWDTTTIWDWINQVNAASFAGHGDWRIPTSAGTSSFATGDPAEAESIWDPAYGRCGGGAFEEACVDPVFEPMYGNSPYWTASTWSDPTVAVQIWYNSLTFPTSGLTKSLGSYVRAVRSVPALQQ
jgi:hypothetical protein